MSDKDDDFQPEEVWDEYVWERFLQEQDRNTEKYFRLLETYMDHPNRDEIIAEEMGWSIYEASVDDEDEDEEQEAPEFVLEDGEDEGDDEFEFDSKSSVYNYNYIIHIMHAHG